MSRALHESDEGRIVGLAPEGEFFIQRLRLNRPQLVAYRRARQVEAKFTVELAANRRRVEELERTVIALRAALESTADEIERQSKGREEEE
jgi:Mg2+ and Co2+ transporter CorA